MGKSWNHKITPLPEAEKTLTDDCQADQRCRDFPQFRVEYEFAPARHNADKTAVGFGTPERRRFRYCLRHASLLCRKEGICLTCGGAFAKSADSDTCARCAGLRDAAARAAADQAAAEISAPPILPPPFGPAPNVRS